MEPTASHVECSDTKEKIDTKDLKLEKTCTNISKKVFIRSTKSFIFNVNKWEKIICSISQQEVILDKVHRNKSFKYSKFTHIVYVRVFYTYV